MPQTLVSFPNYLAALGAASSLRIGVRFVWVTTAAGETRVPRSEFLAGELDDAFAAAERARVWAYRNT